MLSDWTAHRDANQGACNNSCRMPYRLFANAHPQGDDYQPQQGSFELERSDAPGAERIYTAGEKEYLAWQDRKDKGVPVGDAIQKEFVGLRDELNLPYKFPFEA